MTYMDGKSGAEELVGRMLADPALLQVLGSTPNPAATADAQESPPEAASPESLDVGDSAAESADCDASGDVDSDQQDLDQDN